MIGAFFKQLAPLSAEQIHILTPMEGVQTLDFDCLPSPVPFAMEPSIHRYEALFCQSGQLSLRRKDGELLFLGEHEILLLSDPDAIEELSFCGERFQGVLVSVNCSAARDSLSQICALLGHLTLDMQRLQQLMEEKGGCTVLPHSVWGLAVFAALCGLSGAERGRYCTLKSVELLYLLCSGTPLLLGSAESAHSTSQPLDIIQQVHDYMLRSLEQPLTIQQLAQQFHISATQLKQSFRQRYGQSIHQYLLDRRMERAAELLSSTPWPILRIAGTVGYESVSQFGVAFKRRYKMPPSQYRKLSLQQGSELLRNTSP
jgi:AraC-like DNA-binding protein